MLLWPQAISGESRGIQSKGEREVVIRDAHPKRITFVIPEDRPKKPKIRIRRWNNCVNWVRAHGYRVPRTLDGYARTVPTSPNLPPEGQLVVIKTAESKMGHVLVGRLINGQIISVIDSVGEGRAIPLTLYRGYVKT